MSKPIVAVVGRPNVGKSTLFNSLCGQQISIVKDTPGVTRDRIYAEVSWLNHNFTLIDTGGIEPDTGDIILSQMREQAEIAIETADVIIFMTDVKQGLVDSDSKVADMLRRSHKPVILVVNKVDSFEKMMPDVYEFYNLGIGEPFPISAVNKLGFGEVLDEVVSHFPEGSDTDEEDDRPKVAIIGKPNVGKSSIINKLVGKNRVIVSDIAGTTRDAIDTAIKYNGKEYVFIDTAGLRRKSKIKEDLERFSIIRTVAAVERADIAILVIDATEGVTEQDAKIAGIAHERGKGIIIAVNKWDDIEKNDKTIYEFTNKIKDTLAFMSYAEIIFVSAKTGQRLNKIYELVDGEEALIDVICASNVSETRFAKNKVILKMLVRDDTGDCVITWFNQTYVKNKFKVGERYQFYGKISIKYGRVEMTKPVFDKEGLNKNTGKIIPIYPLTYKLSQNRLRGIIENGLEKIKGKLEETIPEYILKQYNLMDLNLSLIHI